MKATEHNLLKFLKNAEQFSIPIYQRTYSWTERECSQLWEDVLRTGRTDTIKAHFIGSIVYIAEDIYTVARMPSLQVIDGQQRVATAMLILEALARSLCANEPVRGFSARKVRNYYLLNSEEEGNRHFKLLLTQTDKESLLALMQQKQVPSAPSVRIRDNFRFFQERIEGLGGELEPLCRGLEKLMIVDIALTCGQDNPQLIFESMNSTRLDLTQADFIRNFTLMGLEPRLQQELYEDHWRPMELAFGQEAYSTNFDGFIRHYLTVKTGEIPKIRAVYEAFKRHVQACADNEIKALVSDMHTFARYYCKMALDQEQEKKLASAFRNLRELKVDVAYPLLLELYDEYASGILSVKDFVEAVRLVESYVFRRAVCDFPPNSLNKIFATLGREIDKDHYLESLQANVLTFQSYRRFPTNEEFKQKLSERDLYNFPRRSYWLRRLESHGRKERVPIEYTIEHILPQNENLSCQWKKALGPEWERVQNTWVHTLGNLTLTAYNPEYSDRPIAEKRDMEGGFRESPIRLNDGLGAIDKWNEAAIRERSVRLADRAVNVWCRPVLPVDVRETYKKSVRRRSSFSLDAHRHLREGGPMRTLFDQFRKEVLALDPSISEKILKWYIAFNAETNFVEVEPQKTRLHLSLYMPFRELRDPKGFATDVTDLGRRTRGYVRVGLNRYEDLPYVMGLVQQAFEWRIGDSVFEP